MTEYHQSNCRIEADTPVEVGHGQGHFWFSALHLVGTDALVCAVVRSADVAQGKWPGELFISEDAGAHWRQDLAIDSYGHASVSRDDTTTLIMPYELWPVAPGDRRNCAAPGTLVTRAADGTFAVESQDVRFVGMPAPLATYHDDELFLHHTGNIIFLPDATLLTTLYGKLEADERMSTFAFVSGDGGFTWRYRGTVAGADVALEAQEGPNESATQLLDDGELLCVYRVGGGSDYHRSYSGDEGRTWSTPARMEGVRSVQPRLVRLGNGALVLTGGRPGLFLWVSADGSGEEWDALNLGAHHNRFIEAGECRFSEAFCNTVTDEDPDMSTAYTGLVACGSDGVTVTYDRLANGWSGAPGPNGDVDRVFSLTLRVAV